MLLEYLGWLEAARLVTQSLEQTIVAGIVTHDLAQQMEGAADVTCSTFGQAVVDRL